MRGSTRGWFVTCALLLAGGSASAQPAGAQAEALFDEGKRLMAAKKVAEACDAFAGSQKLQPAITTLLNLADCREKNGQLSTAWGLFLDAERETRTAATAGAKQLNKVAKDRAAKLAPRLSKLTIKIAAENRVAGLEIIQSGSPVDSTLWGRELPVDGGKLTIVARAAGHREWTTTVDVAAEKDSKSVDVPRLQEAPRTETPVPPTGTPTGPTTGPETGAPSEPEEPETPPSSGSKTIPIALAAAGVALAGGALGFELWGRSKYDDAKVEPDNQKQETLWKQANTRRYMAIGLGATAAACAGVSIFLFVRNRGESQETVARQRGIHVEPVAGVGVAGLLVRGSW